MNELPLFNRLMHIGLIVAAVSMVRPSFDQEGKASDSQASAPAPADKPTPIGQGSP